MSHQMTLKDKAAAAAAMVRWFELQDISSTQSLSVSLMYLAGRYVAEMNNDPSEQKERRSQIIGLFDSFVELLKQMTPSEQ
jgi:hypothetical protein